MKKSKNNHKWRQKWLHKSFSPALRHNRRAPRVELCRNAAYSHRHRCRSVFSLAGSAQRCGPRAKGLGPLGRGPSGPLGPFGAQGPFGALGVFPKPFRVDGYYEWMAIQSGWLLRVDGFSEWMATLILCQHYVRCSRRKLIIYFGDSW